MLLSKKDLTSIGDVINNKLKSVKKDVKAIKKDVSVMLDVLDRKDNCDFF
jgi:hypothetical protein